MARMLSGYAFEADPKVSGDDYSAVPNDDWEIVCYSPDGRETELGRVKIDGAACVAFQCSDGLYRAQMAHMVQ